MNDNARNRTTLSPKQEAAALSLATGATKVEAAGSVDVAVRTIKAWMMLPPFKRRVHQLRSELTHRAIGILADNAASFALTLATVSREAPKHRDRAAAAKAGLDVLGRLNEKIALEERIAALEDQQSLTPRPRIA
jgi:hypothetical protein